MSAALKVSRELQQIAQRLDGDLERVAGTRVGFTLFVWTDGRSNYISTADRAEMIAVLEQHIAGWKQGAADMPAHEVQG